VIPSLSAGYGRSPALGSTAARMRIAGERERERETSIRGWLDCVNRKT
jgi:hypothetical protein